MQVAIARVEASRKRWWHRLDSTTSKPSPIWFFNTLLQSTSAPPRHRPQTKCTSSMGLLSASCQCSVRSSKNKQWHCLKSINDYIDAVLRWFVSHPLAICNLCCCNNTECQTWIVNEANFFPSWEATFQGQLPCTNHCTTFCIAEKKTLAALLGMDLPLAQELKVCGEFANHTHCQSLLGLLVLLLLLLLLRDCSKCEAKATGECRAQARKNHGVTQLGCCLGLRVGKKRAKRTM